MDFAPEGRQDVINYVMDKYGRDKVVQIIAFGTMQGIKEEIVFLRNIYCL